MKIVATFAALALVASAGAVYAQSNMTDSSMSSGMTKPAHAGKMKSMKSKSGMKKGGMHSSMSSSNMTGNMTANSH